MGLNSFYAISYFSKAWILTLKTVYHIYAIKMCGNGNYIYHSIYVGYGGIMFVSLIEV